MARSSLVVLDARYAYSQGRVQEHPWFEALADLLAWCEEEHFTHAWLADTSSSRSFFLDPMATPGDIPGWNHVAAYETPAKDRYSYVTARRTSKRHEDRVQVGFPSFSYWPWDLQESPATLFATIGTLEHILRMPLEWTPGHMALDLLRADSQVHWHWLLPWDAGSLESITPSFRYHHTAREIRWRSSELAAGNYIVKIDKNSAHGAACTGLRVGQGNPTRDETGMYFDGRRPGFWYIEIKRNAGIFDGVRAPGFGGCSWQSTDMVNRLIESNCNLIIKHGWYWPTYHQTLRKTMNSLWLYRQNLHPNLGVRTQAELNAYASMNAIMHALPGKLGDSDTRERYFRRRDMWAQICARSTATLMWNITDIHRQYGLLPVMIDIDALYYACSTPDQLTDYLDPFALGGFKQVYSLPVTREIAANWGSQSSRTLNTLAKTERIVL